MTLTNSIFDRMSLHSGLEATRDVAKTGAVHKFLKLILPDEIFRVLKEKDEKQGKRKRVELR
jgi:hypothetical protein